MHSCKAVNMNHCSKSVVFAVLACSVAFAAVLQFEPLKISKHLQAEMDEVMKLVMKPHILSRYIPAEVYENMGLEANTRLMSYEWHNCGDKAVEKLHIHNLTLQPDPLEFPGNLSVSFNISIDVSVSSELKGVVLLEKKVGTSWIKIPCLAQFGSCTYDDICELLDEIQCPPEFVKDDIPCKCPFNQGKYNLPKTTFEVGGFLLPTGDYHIQANITHGDEDGGCYEVYASIA